MGSPEKLEVCFKSVVEFLSEHFYTTLLGWLNSLRQIQTLKSKKKIFTSHFHFTLFYMLYAGSIFTNCSFSNPAGVKPLWTLSHYLLTLWALKKVVWSKTLPVWTLLCDTPEPVITDSHFCFLFIQLNFIYIYQYCNTTVSTGFTPVIVQNIKSIIK